MRIKGGKTCEKRFWLQRFFPTCLLCVKNGITKRKSIEFIEQMNTFTSKYKQNMMTPSNSYSQQWHHHREKTSYFIQKPTITSSFITIKFISATSVLPFRQTHNVTTTQDQHGRSPMSAAAEFGNVDIVRMLLEAKSDKDSMDQQGRSPVTSLFRRKKNPWRLKPLGSVWRGCLEGGVGPWCEVLVGFVWFFGGLSFWYPERLKVLSFFVVLFLLVGCFWHFLEWECVCTDFIIIYWMYSKYMWPVTTASFIVSY